MEEVVERLFEQAREHPGWLFVAMFAGAFLEYIVPPFPGDLCTVLGAIFIPQGSSFWSVFLGVNAGAAAGFCVDYAFGRWLSDPRRAFRHWGPRWGKMARGIDRIAAGFERHTALYLLVNRFLPGIRALFFVAAGFSRVPIGKVVAFGLLSSMAWSLLLMAVGGLVGYKRDVLIFYLSRYTWAVWAALALAAAVYVLRRWMKRRSQGRSAREGDGV